jgi:hypothetical protein
MLPSCCTQTLIRLAPIAVLVGVLALVPVKLDADAVLDSESSTRKHGTMAHLDGEICIEDDEVQRILKTLPEGNDPGCITCHGEIENATERMGFELGCTWCHGGDPLATTINEAHVLPTLPVIMDQTVPPLDYDLPYQKFVNPTNLRVVEDVCICHYELHIEVPKAMMTTAAGHYAGGLYVNGVVDTKTPIYGTFAVTDDDGYVPVEKGAVASLEDLIVYDPTGDPQQFATHFAAVPGQACARCHLWSRGKGYRGAENKDGVYRADGCAGCHMHYSNDGRSQSADPSINHVEQGHPLVHTISKATPTEQCLHCHHRGARIGLSYTGRAQMPPDLPSGPGVPGTTDERFNGNYHMTDPETNPADIHHERGLHCIDCHTRTEVMGDGNIYGHMDQATKIECRTCHGMPDAPGTFLDNDGDPLWNIDLSGPEPVLYSKVDQTAHLPPQIMNLVDPQSPTYNPRAAVAMTADHLKADGGVECYGCHSAWVPNCFGCHFERDEQQMGLNLVTREEEVGKASTNNKIFEALRAFMMGPNSEGRISPYIVGCQAIAEVTAPDGSIILDFVMPETVNGLSGLALQPVHPHTVRTGGEVRTCGECHRSPPTLGFGSGNYALARTNAYAVASDGVRVYDRRSNPDLPTLISTIPVADPRAVATLPNVVEGGADYLYVASGAAGVAIFDMQSGIPGAPVSTIAGINAVDVTRAARYLYVVVDSIGVDIYDNQDPSSAVFVTTIPIPTAKHVEAWGVHLFVAAGDAGLIIVDIADHTAPSIIATVAGIVAEDVVLYSHYQMGRAFAARAYVADSGFGVHVIDLLPEFSAPRLREGIILPGAVGLDTYSRYVIADTTTPSREHDYLYVAAGDAGLYIFDITEPNEIVEAGSLTGLGGPVVDVQVSSQLAPPGVEDYAVLANQTAGLQLVNVTDPSNPALVTAVAAPNVQRVFVDVQQLDRYLDEQGNQLKETSHPFVEVFDRSDIVTMLEVPLEDSVFYACCLPDGSCEEMLQAECLAMGGVPADFGVSCADACGQGVPAEIPALSRAGAGVLIALIVITAALVLRRRA